MKKTLVDLLWDSCNRDLITFYRARTNVYEQCLAIAILGLRSGTCEDLLGILADAHEVQISYSIVLSLSRSNCNDFESLSMKNLDSVFVQIAFYGLLLSRVRDVLPFQPLLKSLEYRVRSVSSSDFVTGGFAPDPIFTSREQLCNTMTNLLKQSRTFKRRRKYPLITVGSSSYLRIMAICQEMLSINTHLSSPK